MYLQSDLHLHDWMCVLLHTADNPADMQLVSCMFNVMQWWFNTSKFNVSSYENKAHQWIPLHPNDSVINASNSIYVQYACIHVLCFSFNHQFNNIMERCVHMSAHIYCSCKGSHVARLKLFVTHSVAFHLVKSNPIEYYQYH